MKLGKPGKLGETRVIGNFHQAGNTIRGKKGSGLGKFMVILKLGEQKMLDWKGSWKNWGLGKL